MKRKTFTYNDIVVYLEINEDAIGQFDCTAFVNDGNKLMYKKSTFGWQMEIQAITEALRDVRVWGNKTFREENNRTQEEQFEDMLKPTSWEGICESIRNSKSPKTFDDFMRKTITQCKNEYYEL